MVDFEYECYQYCKLEDQNAEEDNPVIEQQEEEVTGIEAGDLCDIENEDPEDPLAEFPEGCDPTKENGEKQCPDDLSFTELPPLIPVGGCPEFNPDNDNDADNDGIPDDEDKDDNNDGIPDEEIPITPEPEDCNPDLDPDCPKPTQEDPKEDHPCDVLIEPDCIDPNDVPIINSEEPYDCECENPPDVGEVGYCPPEIWTKQCGDGSDGPVPGTLPYGGEDFCDCDNPNIGPGDIGYCPPEKCQKINPPEVVVVVPEIPTKPPVKPNPFLNQTKGCKDPEADNYDETATVNDPSLCVYPVDADKEPAPVAGCTDDKADNYEPQATIPDGSCTYTIPGCTDREATNFDPEANKDDGTCKYPVEGCTDEGATNYDPAATKDNGTCELPVPGCIDRNALNYNEHATEPDGSCIYPVEGCTDDKAENFNVSANVDDGSCTYVIEGCMDDKAPNFNPEATVHDFSCEPYDVYGCMNPEAANYMEGATKDDGSCFRPGCNDSDATNFDPKATENDGSCIYPEGETPGCMDNRATNYNPNATVDDGTCDIPKILGCTDPSAANYNPKATEPDGSCYDKITITPIIPVTEPVPPTPVTEPVTEPVPPTPVPKPPTHDWEGPQYPDTSKPPPRVTDCNAALRITDDSTWKDYMSQDELKVLAGVQRYRSESNIQPAAFNTALHAAARWYAEWLYNNNADIMVVMHQDNLLGTGKYPNVARATHFGFCGGTYENVSPVADDAVKLWKEEGMDFRPHDVNMKIEATDYAVGSYMGYTVLMLGTPNRQPDYAAGAYGNYGSERPTFEGQAWQLSKKRTFGEAFALEFMSKPQDVGFGTFS